jgi:cob(I)alamin adenosyltransferase
MVKGLIQVYTGDGKGKTTAAIGQGIRACGRGNRVYMVQFLKSHYTGELASIKRLEPDFKVFRFERERDFIWNLNAEQMLELKEDIKKAFEFVQSVMKTQECDLIILDEIMAVMRNGLLKVKDVVELLKSKPPAMEVILTGRNVPEEIQELADYISEIVSRKHPFEKGIAAREGIEY